MAEEISGLSANGYSEVQLLATSSGAEMLNFRLGGTVVGWVPWVVKVVCAAESAAEGSSQLGGLWPISGIAESVQQSRMIRAVSVPILLQVNDHLLQERLKRWYPEWQFTFRKFSPIKGFLFNESLLLHSEWFMAGFKMYCFDYAYTLWTL